MKMFRVLFRFAFTLILCCLIALTSCKKDDDDDDLTGNWIKKSDFEGLPRGEAVAFAIADKGYVTTGYDGEDRLNDLWQYNPDKDLWVQKASLPGRPRNGAVGFGTATKGYVGTGYDGTYKLNDFWEYDPQENAWTQKPDFPGTARYGAVAFSIDNMGYVGTGYDGNVLKDIWQYNPDNEVWTQKVSLGGSKRRDAVSFVVEGKGYIATGVNNGDYIDDFWEYDPKSDTWTRKRDISDQSDDTYDNEYKITRTNSVAFVMGGRGYIATAGTSSVGNDVWEYDPLTDIWEEKTAFEGVPRLDAVSLSIMNKGYVLTGRNSSYYFDDMWLFEPFKEYNEND
jgi:N-acetylneuraminic acid mutarotase